jgi:hypothetical protein
MRENHDKRRKFSARTANLEVSKISPVNLTLFPSYRLKTKIGDMPPISSQARNDCPKLAHLSGVPTRSHHGPQALGFYPRIVQQSGFYGRKIRVHHSSSDNGRFFPRFLINNPPNHRVVDPEIASNLPLLELLYLVQPKNFGLLYLVYL